MRCPECKNHVLQKSGRKTRLRITGRIIFEKGICKSQCYWCKAEIQIPLEIKEGTQIAQERLVICSGV